jgi:formaldehyde-activating enzyme
VRAGVIPRDRVNELGIIVSVWLDPRWWTRPTSDHALLFRTNREATAKAIGKAMRHEPSIDWLLEHQDEVTHYYHELGLKGEL